MTTERQALVERITRYLGTGDPTMILCAKCGGKGYHHGFGESGRDPDWCGDCGGTGTILHPDENADPDDLLRQALEALSSSAPAPQEQDAALVERRADFIANACYETWRAKRRSRMSQDGAADVRDLKGIVRAAVIPLLSSSAPVETPRWQPMATCPKKAGKEYIIRVKVRAGIPFGVLVGHWMPGGHCIEDHPPIDGGWYFWNGCMFDRAAEPLEWMDIPNGAPADPPIQSPGDEERKDEIAKRARRAIDAVVHECGNEVFLGVGYAPDEMLIEELQQALSDYEIKAGSK